LQASTHQHEIIDIVTNLVIKGDLIKITRDEDTFQDGKLSKKHYYTLSQKGQVRLMPFYIRIPSNFWGILKNDGYVFLSMIATILSIISIILTLSSNKPQQ
jgi:hypothetical protein